jgi:LytR cell envelope-related transcriptional attenuator
VLAAAAAAYLVSGGLSSSSSATSRHAAVPVAVFNATGNASAAQGLVATLKADRIHLGAVGNINASLGSGVYVFYPPGAQARARRVAGLIPSLSPTVAPIQPQVQNAVGDREEIVVIFD